MENFEEMLNNYMDNKEITEKINIENEELINDKKNNSKCIHKFENTITIREFVRDYLGTDHNCKNLKHKGLKSFNNPYVIGISNDFAIKNPDYVARNEIIVVIDDYGKPGTYINPNILKKIKTMEEYKLTLSLLEQIKLNDLNNIDTLYKKYTETLEKIDELEKVYVDSCDLLKCLEKRYILKEIRRYVKRAKKINTETILKRKKIEETTVLSYSLLSDLEQEIYNDEYIDDETNIISEKINRQKTKKFKEKG